MTNRKFVLILVMASLLLPAVASAQVTFHAKLNALGNICRQTSDWDPNTIWYNEPDGRYYAAIFESWTDANNHTDIKASVCHNQDREDECTGYNIGSPSEMTWQLPTGRTYAYFHFSLFDEDNNDDDDMGNEWRYTSGFYDTVGLNLNNDSSPYDPGRLCNRDISNSGSHANSFEIDYTLWFTDSSGPTTPGRPSLQNRDSDGSGDNVNTRQIDVSWSSASDAHSGIYGYYIQLRDNATGTTVLNNLSVGRVTSISICSSGCDVNYSLSSGRSYSVRVRSRNGYSPRLTNSSGTFNGAYSSYSSWRTINIDTTYPSTAIPSPTYASWHRANFSAQFDDGDGGGSGLQSCRWEVRSGTPIADAPLTLNNTSRVCDSSRTVTVGGSGYCRTEGSLACRIYSYVLDNAGNPSSAIRTISIDWTADAITTVSARESSTGPTIPASGWTRDQSPYFSFSSSSTSPIAAYGWAMDATPDCGSPQLGGGTSQNVQIPTTLTDGNHTFRVRAIDTAGNCGSSRSFSFGVDTQGDQVASIRAFAPDSGPELFHGVYHRYTNPTVTWTPGTSSAPIVGYSWGTGLTTNCSMDGSAGATSTDLSGLPDGITQFWVRTIDAAGNCGSPQSFNIAIDTQGDNVPALWAETPGGASISDGVWQTENSPVMYWTAPTSSAAVAGYSYGLGSDTECEIDTDATSISLSSLADGSYSFWVRAVDAAGNCSPSPTRFDLFVDTQGDPIPNVRAFTTAGGTQIVEATYQNDNDPYITWSAPTGGSPILGYEIGIDSPPSCGTTLTGTAYQISAPLDDGEHVVYIRALDQVGNCTTPASEFNLWVLATAPEIVVETISPNPAGADDEVTITVSTNQTLQSPPSVTIGDSLSPVYFGVDDNIYTYRYDVQGTEAEGPADVVAVGRDLADNVGTGGGQLTFDFTPPELVALIIDPGVVTTDDRILISVEMDEALRSAPVVNVDDTNPTTLVSEDDGVYGYEYDVTGGEGEGRVQVSVEGTDLAGNSATFVDTFDLDLTPPDVTVTSPDTRLVLDMGSDVELRWTTTDEHPDTVTIQLSLDGGDTFDSTLATDIEDTGSFVWTVDAAETNNARFRVIATDEAGLSGSDLLVYDLRIRVPVADHILAIPNDGVAVIGMTERVNLTVVDRQGDPVMGEFAVSVTVTGSAIFVGGSLSGGVGGSNLITGSTEADGTAFIDVLDFRAETVELEPDSAEMDAEVGHIDTSIVFTPESADHLMVAVDDGVANVGEVERLTIISVDASGNPTDSDAFIRVVVDGFATISNTSLNSALGVGSFEISGQLIRGSATVDVVDIVAEEVLVLAASETLPNAEPDEEANVLFLQQSEVDPLRVSISAVPQRVFADGVAVSLITVTPRNGAGDVLGSGIDVDLIVDFGEYDEVVDVGDGTYTAELYSEACADEDNPTETEHSVVIGARIEDVAILNGPRVTFTCDSIGSALLEADPDRIVGDGASCTDLSLTLFDIDGEVLTAGQWVDLDVTYGDLGEIVEDDGGTYRAELCTELCAADPIRITPIVNGQTLSDVAIDVVVECLGVSSTLSTIDAIPISIDADGLSASTIVVRPVRLDEREMGPGLNVQIFATLGELTEVNDVGDGTYTAQLTSTDPGESVVTATVAGVPLDADDRVTILPYSPAADSITLEAYILEGTPSPGAVVTVGVDVSNLTFRTFDATWLGFRLDVGHDSRRMLVYQHRLG